MNIKVDMVFLGAEQKESKKTQSAYFMAKLMDMGTSAIYEFYVKGDSPVIANLVKVAPLSPVKAILKISSYQGKAQVDLDGIN